MIYGFQIKSENTEIVLGTEQDIEEIEKKSIRVKIVSSLHQSAALNNWKNVQRFGLKLGADR